MSPWGLLAFGGLRSGLIDGRSGLEERVWRMDIWSWRWLPLETNDVSIGKGPVQPYKHREVCSYFVAASLHVACCVVSD